MKIQFSCPCARNIYQETLSRLKHPQNSGTTLHTKALLSAHGENYGNRKFSARSYLLLTFSTDLGFMRLPVHKERG